MRIVLTALLFGSFVFCTPATSHAIGDPDIRARITNIRRSSAEDEEREFEQHLRILRWGS